MKAIVEKRGLAGMSGPDTYVAVQLVPDGVEPLTALRRDIARKRGIEIVYCGEGYRAHTGPRSGLGKALAEAEALAARVNNERKTK